MANRLVVNITDDYFTCSICCTIFEDPRQTPCEHTFCLKCLKKYSSRFQGKEFVCPICRTVTKIDNHTSVSHWVLELPVDTFLLLIMKTVNSYQNLNSNTLELPDEPEIPTNTQVCPIHKGRQLSIYCNNHSKRLCFECAWQKHTSCECISIKEESLDQRCQNTKNVLTKYVENIRAVKRKLQSTETVFNNDKKLALSGIEEIQKRLQDFWGKMQINVQKNLQEIHSTSVDITNRKTSVNDLIVNLDKLLLKLNSLDKMSAEDKMSILNEIDQEMTQTTDILSTLEDSSFDYRSEFSINSELMEMLDKFDRIGTLTVTKPFVNTNKHGRDTSYDFCCTTECKTSVTIPKSTSTNIQRTSVTVPDSACPDRHRTSVTVSDSTSTKRRGTSVTESSVVSSSDQILDSVHNTMTRNSPGICYVPSDSVDLDLSLTTGVTRHSSDEFEVLDPIRETLPDTQSDRQTRNHLDDDETICKISDWSNMGLDTSEQYHVQKMITHNSTTTRRKKNETATLSGICIAGNHVIVADQYNNCISRFDRHTKELKGEITVQEPHKLSLIPRTDNVLLTCWDESKIYIISTDIRFQIHNEIQTMRNYLGICAVDQNRILATATDRGIDLLSFKGHVLLSIKPIQSGVLPNFVYRQNFLLPADIGSLDDDNIVIHDGMKKSIICFALSGNIKWQRKIKGISGIRCYKNEIYVSIGSGNTVMKLNIQGKVLDSDVLSNFTIRRPWAIDISEDFIVVTEDSPSSIVHFFTFNT